MGSLGARAGAPASATRRWQPRLRVLRKKAANIQGVSAFVNKPPDDRSPPPRRVRRGGARTVLTKAETWHAQGTVSAALASDAPSVTVIGVGSAGGCFDVGGTWELLEFTANRAGRCSASAIPFLIHSGSAAAASRRTVCNPQTDNARGGSKDNSSAMI